MLFTATASEYITANQRRERAALGVAYMHSVSWREGLDNGPQPYRTGSRALGAIPGLVIRKLRAGAMPLQGARLDEKTKSGLTVLWNI